MITNLPTILIAMAEDIQMKAQLLWKVQYKLFKPEPRRWCWKCSNLSLSAILTKPSTNHSLPFHTTNTTCRHPIFSHTLLTHYHLTSPQPTSSYQTISSVFTNSTSQPSPKTTISYSRILSLFISKGQKKPKFLKNTTKIKHWNTIQKHQSRLVYISLE